MLPTVTVIIPIRNEQQFIRRCVDAVLAQDYPRDRVDIVVADGMSTDGTREIVESMKNGGVPIKLIPNPGRIAPTGLNAAIAHARGEIIARVDGHCEIARDYLTRCVQHLRSGVDAVGGPLHTVGDTVVARAIALGMSSPFGVGNSAFRTTSRDTMLVDTVAFPAYWRTTLERLGPFDEELVRNQDDEYNYRLRRHGGRVLLAADVRSTYFSRSAVKGLWRQYFQYGYYKVRVLQKHPRQMCLRQFAPPLFVVALLTALVAAPFTPAGYWPVAAVVGPYVLATLAASAWVARRDPKLFPLLPVVFSTLHVAYGTGFLAGLAGFRKRWRDRGRERPRDEQYATTPDCREEGR